MINKSVVDEIARHLVAVRFIALVVAVRFIAQSSWINPTATKETVVA